MSALGHSRPRHFLPVLNNVRYASDSDHSRYGSELTVWAISGLTHCNMIGETLTFCSGLFLIFERTRKEFIAADGMRGSTS
jgi:hypothetical protein